MSTLLEVIAITKHFGGVKALDGVSLAVEDGDVLGVLGPNGSGKTTLFNVISGFLRATGGDVVYEGRSLRSRRPDEIADAGIARTFQLVQPFVGMTGREVLSMALGAKRPRRLRAGKVAKCWASADELAEELGIRSTLERSASDFQTAELRLLDIGRAMATEPRVLLLDEPFASLSAAETERVSDVLRQLQKRGTTLVMVEHNLRPLMRLIDTAVVLNFGKLIACGLPSAVVEEPAVVEAYLGKQNGKECYATP